MFVRLANTPCTNGQFQEFLQKLMPDPSKPASADQNQSVLQGYETRMETILATRKAVMTIHHEGIPELNIPPAENDWWGALNSVTAWSDHIQATESDRYAHLLLGSGDKLKSAALARIQATLGIGAAVAS